MAVGDYAASLTDIAIMMTEEYQQIKEEKLRVAGEGPFNPLRGIEEADRIEVEMAAEIPKLREKRIANYQRLLSQYSGTGGQSSAGGQGGITDVVEEFSEYQPSGQ